MFLFPGETQPCQSRKRFGMLKSIDGDQGHFEHDVKTSLTPTYKSWMCYVHVWQLAFLVRAVPNMTLLCHHRNEKDQIETTLFLRQHSRFNVDFAV